MQLDDLIKSFFSSLRLLTRFRLPGEDAHDPRLILAFFPLTGLIAGLVPAVLAWLLLYGTGRMAGAFLCALLLPPLYWWLTDGRNLKAVIWTAANWRVSDVGEAEDRQCRPYWIMLAVQTVFVSRLALTGLVAAFGVKALAVWPHPDASSLSLRIFWLALAPVLGMAAHADLLSKAVLPDRSSLWPPPHWILAAVLVLVPALLMQALLPALLALVLAWAVTGWAGRWIQSRCAPPLEFTHGAVRELVELMTLLAGLLYFSAGV